MKFICKCGNVIRDQTFPNPGGLSIIFDEALDALDEPMEVEVFATAASRAFQCSNCRRLWIFWKDTEGKKEEFAPIDAQGRIAPAPTITS